MTDLRTAYATALLRRLEEHAGPLADVVPLMERLDVLTGLDLEQKRLSAGSSFGPSGEDEKNEPPSIEHGSGQEPNVSGQTPAAGPGSPDPLPVVHEAPQQAPVSASDGPEESPPVGPPAAPSPEAIPPEPYNAPSTPRRVPCIDCGNPSSVGKNRCPSCAGKAAWTPERRAAQSERAKRGPYGANRQLPSDDKAVDTRPEHSDVAQTQAPGTDATTEEPDYGVLYGDAAYVPDEPEVVIVDKEPTEVDKARGRAAVTSNPPVAAPAKFVCTCSDWWRENTAGWREEIPNEGHHEACALYRKGGHRWPLPSRKGDEAGPFVIQCGWCRETREVDQHGVAWAVSERNPAVSVTSPFSKNAKAPV